MLDRIVHLTQLGNRLEITVEEGGPVKRKLYKIKRAQHLDSRCVFAIGCQHLWVLGPNGSDQNTSRIQIL